MAKQLDNLRDQFDRADQENKREIGEYFYRRPAQWIPRQEIVEEFDIDESGVSRHISALYEEEFLLSKRTNDQRYVQWNGRGAGGVGYWIRQMVPQQLWSAGSELRPLLTLDTLGGAYVPTILFGGLIILGFFTAVLAILITYLPSDSVLGVTVTEIVVLNGLISILAALLVLLIPFIRLLELGFERVWNQGAGFINRKNGRD